MSGRQKKEKVKIFFFLILMFFCDFYALMYDTSDKSQAGNFYSLTEIFISNSLRCKLNFLVLTFIELTAGPRFIVVSNFLFGHQFEDSVTWTTVEIATENQSRLRRAGYLFRVNSVNLLKRKTKIQSSRLCQSTVCCRSKSWARRSPMVD